MPRLIAEFPGFRPRWERHLELWKGEPAGSYNDIAQFAHFVVENLYPIGNTEDLQRAFNLMEHWLVNGNRNLRNLIEIGFLEGVQNVASWQAFGREVFIPFLGPQCRQAWDEIERTWAGKQVSWKSSGLKERSPSNWRKIAIALIDAGAKFLTRASALKGAPVRPHGRLATPLPVRSST
jgi:hypothetical protein